MYVRHGSLINFENFPKTINSNNLFIVTMRFSNFDSNLEVSCLSCQLKFYRETAGNECIIKELNQPWTETEVNFKFLFLHFRWRNFSLGNGGKGKCTFTSAFSSPLFEDRKVNAFHLFMPP